MAVHHAKPRRPRPRGPDPRRIEAVRRLNRFYTRHLGLLDGGLLDTPFSLTEARLLYELATHEGSPTAKQCSAELDLDAGYLSRILRGLERRRLLRRERSPADRRHLILSLTERGRAAFDRLDAASQAQVHAMLARLSPAEQDRLVQAMQTVERALGEQQQPVTGYTLRPHRSGDMGWVVQRHGELYQAEYGWDATFEALVAEIVAAFIRRLDASRERCWIAEKDGRNVGSVFLVRHKERPGFARLRLLLVDPEARGLGIGRRLVQECTAFARGAGYRAITLWTNSVLRAAQTLYEQEGYRLVLEEAHHSFGHDLVSETWELQL
jgi:DNA-binding MarR family transcriptional regulator/GNAT superfamily N-acetyltransferase